MTSTGGGKRKPKETLEWKRPLEEAMRWLTPSVATTLALSSVLCGSVGCATTLGSAPPPSVLTESEVVWRIDCSSDTCALMDARGRSIPLCYSEEVSRLDGWYTIAPGSFLSLYKDAERWRASVDILPKGR